MKQTDYEKAKAEAWTKFFGQELNGRPQWEPISNEDVFDCAFKAAYLYCSMEKARPYGNGDHIPDATKKVDRAMIAAMAVQGILSGKDLLLALNNQVNINKAKGDDTSLETIVAREAICYADALLAELGKEGLNHV